MIRIALFQPDIPQNAGAILRTAACLGLAVDLVEPAGFVLTDRAMRRAGLDTAARAVLVRHPSWDAFLEATRAARRRLVLFTTAGDRRHHEIVYGDDDVLLFGRESSGAPSAVHACADVRARIPVAPGTRSLNVSVAVGIAAAEALRQLGAFPADAPGGDRDGCPRGPGM